MSDSVYPLEIKKLELNTITVGETPYGKGVFASKRIKANTPIGKIEGEFFADKKYDSAYAMSFNGGALEPEEPYRFVNHSCTPNCELVELCVEDENSDMTFHELWIYSIRAIAKSEQLTLDYAWPAKYAIECLCGSPSCRGWIVDPDELSKVVAKRGLGSLDSGSKPVKAKKTAAKKTVAKKTIKKSAVKSEESKELKESENVKPKKKVVKKAAVKKTADKKTVVKKSAKKTTIKKTAAKKAVKKSTK